MNFSLSLSCQQLAVVTFNNEYYRPDELHGDNCFEDTLSIASSVNKETILEYINDIKFASGTKSKYSKGIYGAATYLKKGLPESKCVYIFRVNCIRM